MSELNQESLIKIKSMVVIETMAQKKYQFYSEICSEPIVKTLCQQNSAIHSNHIKQLENMIASEESTSS